MLMCLVKDGPTHMLKAKHIKWFAESVLDHSCVLVVRQNRIKH